MLRSGLAGGFSTGMQIAPGPASGEAAAPARTPWWRRGVRNGVAMGLLALAAILLLSQGELPGLGRVLAELPAGVAIDGVDLLQVATGKVPALAERPIFWQSGYYRAVRIGDWKLQVSERPKKVWLYNLATDPTEKTNLAASMPDRVASLRALLDKHQADARKPLYPYTIEAATPVDKTRADTFRKGDEYIYWPN